MIRKNILLALRSFKKSKAITAINILGLAVGISASLVIFMIVRYDYNFDKWEPRGSDIYRVITSAGKTESYACVSMLAPQAIRENITGIDAVAHYIQEPFYDAHISTGKMKNGKPEVFTNVENIAFADENYFKIFPRQWLAGNPKSLNQLHSVVLSLSSVRAYFPKEAPDQVIGRRIVFEDSINAVVTGVVTDVKDQTDLNAKIFLSLPTLTNTSLSSMMMQFSWTNLDGASKCFVLLHPGTKVSEVNAALHRLYAAHIKEQTPHKSVGLLQPLADIHFNTALDGAVSKSSLLNLGGLALLLLLLAVINFVNLSTSMSTLRAKEIGVRKVFGGNNRQIVYQFLTETFMLTLFASLLAIILSPLLIHIFKGFIPDGLTISAILQPGVALFLVMILVSVTLLAGLYPAFVLTKFRPAIVLKNQITKGRKSRSAHLRQVLTVGQFVVAQIFLVAVVIIGQQMHFVFNRDLGFRKDAIVSLTIPDFQLRNASKKYVLLNELRQLPGIQSYSLCSAPPVRNGWSSTRLTWTKGGISNESNDVHVRSADDHYIELFNLKLAAGKNIHIDTSALVTDVLVNETLLHQMGYALPADAIGQLVKGGPADSARIVGVLKDFTTMSLHSPIQPTAVFADNHSFGYYISIALNAGQPQNWKGTIEKTRQLFRALYPNNDIELTFFDDAIKRLYDNDLRISKLLKWATGLAIFISCLGLLGLVSFMANQRIKEIGIRKVLGASVTQIIVLLSRSLIQLVLVASIIAFPIAWYFSHKWLQDFAYKTKISWWVFFMSGVGMMIIALAVLFLRTLKSAKANPADSLKVE